MKEENSKLNKRYEKLRDAKEYAESIVKTVREPLIILNDNLNIISANNSFYNTFKAAKKDTIGKRIYDIGNGQWNIPKFRKLLEHILAKKTVFEDFEVTHKFETIGEKIMLLNARELIQKSENKRLILLAIEDITARRKIEEALKQSYQKLKELDILKTRFLSIISHELRSPMTPMKAQSQMLLEGYFGRMNKKQKDSVDMILRNTNILDRIIFDLLEVSRIRAARLKLNFVKTNIGGVTKKVMKEMEQYFPEKNIEIVLNLRKLPTIKTDPDRVIQVLRNLIDNAKKFSPNNSKIFVSAGLKGNAVQFSVKDQGIGIAAGSQKRIFEPFFQAEQTIYREYRGTGLGLTICKGIAETLGGKIWFESQEGKGSTFYFTVPLKPVKKAESKLDMAIRK